MTDWTVLERPLTAPLAVCLSVGIAVGTLLGWSAGRWSTSFLDVRWLEWTTALATVAAVIVAILLALRDQIRLRHARDNAASLVAASISPKLRIACHDLELLRARLAFGCPKTYAEALMWGGLFVESPELEISQAQLESLVPLPNRCAHRIAKGVSLLTFAKVKIASQMGLMAVHSSLPVQQGSLEAWSRYVDEAYTYLIAGTRVCERLADVSIPVPSPTELYGYPF